MCIRDSAVPCLTRGLHCLALDILRGYTAWMVYLSFRHFASLMGATVGDGLRSCPTLLEGVVYLLCVPLLQSIVCCWLFAVMKSWLFRSWHGLRTFWTDCFAARSSGRRGKVCSLYPGRRSNKAEQAILEHDEIIRFARQELRCRTTVTTVSL